MMELKTFDHLLDLKTRAWRRSSLQVGAVLAVVLLSTWYVGLFDMRRLMEGDPQPLQSVKGDVSS